MSKNSKNVLVIIIVIVAVLLGWWYVSAHSAAVVPATAPVTDNQGMMEGQMAAASDSVPVQGLTTSPSDTSDAALNSDISSIDTQTSAAAQDSNAAEAQPQ